MIHHLSYPEGSSINDFIPDDLCSVFYTTVDDAISIIKTMGRECLLAKTDIASGFRILPVHPDDHELSFKTGFIMTSVSQWGVLYRAPNLNPLAQL